MSTILKAENIAKQYRLGKVGSGTLSHDLNRWWHVIRGKEDPYLKVGAVNDRSQKAKEEYVWALRDINFEINKGEVLGVIGKNGAGKSTLLKILSRVTSPTIGNIKTKGRIASLLEVGTGFHGELTGRENIYMNGAILGMTKKEINRKLDEIIDFSGCEMYIDTPVKRYSSGMTVRLGFAVAAHLEPEILVIDEVLAVGDAEFQKKAIGKMQNLSQGEGRTVIFVSHNMASVKNLCSHALVLENGRISFEGEVGEGVEYYLSSNNVHNIKPINTRTDRKGNKALKFINIQILNNKGDSINAFFTNDSVVIELEYIVYDPGYLKNFILSIIIYDKEEKVVAFFPSDEFVFKLDYMKSKLKLSIEKFNLRPGLYSISLYSFFDNTIISNYIDTIDHVFSFEILPIRVNEGGRLIRSGNTAFLDANYSQ